MITNPSADQSKTETDTDIAIRYWGTKPKPPQPPQPDVIKGSFTTGIAAVACKSDVSWAKGLLVAEHFNYVADYRSRNGFPTENLAALDSGFWAWAERKGLSIAECRSIIDATPILEWDEFLHECIEGSNIRESMIDLNVEHITNDVGYGQYPVLEWLNQPAATSFEGGEKKWNRPELKYGGQLYAFVSKRSGPFNAKPRIPRWNSADGKYIKYEAPKKIQGGEGNKVFFPDVDQIACDLLIKNFDLPFEITPENYWDIVLSFPKLIPVGITEGAKKALSLISDGFPCVALLGIGNWSVSGSDPRQLLPQLAELAAGGRQINIWYDMDDPIAKVKAFLNGKSQGGKLLAALKEAKASNKSQMMWWDLKLGKGIDDAKASLVADGFDLSEWILATMELSRQREIYAKTSVAYKLDPNREIERDTVGDYIPGGIMVKPGCTTAIIADTGSGKTHQIREMIASCKALGIITIVFVPTIKLGEQIAFGFGLPHRYSIGEDGQVMEIGDVMAEARRCGGLVICPDSIDLALTLIKNSPNYIVVCDEAAKVLEHLTSGNTLGDRYSEINLKFAELTKNAQSLIIAEAKLAEADLVTFEGMSGKRTLVYQHRRETAKKEIKIYTGAPGAISAALMAEAIERLSGGQRVAIATDSQRMAIQIEMILKERFPDKLGIRNDAQTSYLPEVKELTRNPNKFLAQKQLDYLIYSPVCKAGWDLTGFDIHNGIRSEYQFDAVCCFFGVLPTSDHIQMLARYRVVVPVSISCPELISAAGDEMYVSGKDLKKWREKELNANINLCGLADVIRPGMPLQALVDNLYLHNTIRNAREKSIARYSLEQRLIDDGHSVTLEPVSMREIKISDPDRHETLMGICQQRKANKKTIEHDWAELLDSIPLRPEFDDLTTAAMLDCLDAPTPEQRAKVVKIRYVYQFPGAPIDAGQLYYATRDYGKLSRAGDLHAKMSFVEVVKAAQQMKNSGLLKEDLIAIHQFDKTLWKVDLMAGSGILGLLVDEYHNGSPELIALKAYCVKNAPQFKRWLGLQFHIGHTPVDIFCRLLHKMSLKTLKRRPDADLDDPNTQNRPRYYRVATQSLVEARIESVMDEIAELKGRLDTSDYYDPELVKRSAWIQKLAQWDADQEARLDAANTRAEANPNRFAGSRDKQQAKADKAAQRLAIAVEANEQRAASQPGRIEARIAHLENVTIPALLELANEIIARDHLVAAATRRLMVASTTTTNKDSKADVDATLPAMNQKDNLVQLDLDFRRKTG